MFNALKARAEIVEWIKLWFADKGKNSKAVIGISGGKDSTVAAALCAEALGPDRVIGVMMPNGRQKDQDDAIEVCEKLNIKYMDVNICDIYNAFLEEIYLNLPHDTAISNDTKINLAPRIRMTVLYAIAASVNGYVVNTSNKCEAFIGYCTKWGDNVGDLAPLVELMVSEVVAIGKIYEEIPARLIEKAPADGLSGMSDEEKLGFRYEEVEKCIKNWNNCKIQKIPHYREIVLAQKHNEHKGGVYTRSAYIKGGCIIMWQWIILFFFLGTCVGALIGVEVCLDDVSSRPKKIEKINAEQAKELTYNTRIDYIYDSIKTCTEMSYSNARIEGNKIDNDIIKILEEDGYKVEKVPGFAFYEVSWAETKTSFD